MSKPALLFVVFASPPSLVPADEPKLEKRIDKLEFKIRKIELDLRRLTRRHVIWDASNASYSNDQTRGWYSSYLGLSVPCGLRTVVGIPGCGSFWGSSLACSPCSSFSARTRPTSWNQMQTLQPRRPASDRALVGCFRRFIFLRQAKKLSFISKGLCRQSRMYQ